VSGEAVDQDNEMKTDLECEARNTGADLGTNFELELLPVLI